jgi:hypothetical protein
MRAHRSFARIGSLLGVLALAGGGLAAAQAQAPAPAPASHPVTFTVTSVGGEREAAISKDDVRLRLRRNQITPVDGWAREDKLFLAILIDDSIDRAAGSHWRDLQELIRSQRATTLVAVGYLRNNGTTLAQDFTADHEAAANALRIPFGDRGPSSPYLAVLDMLRRWPKTGPRRSILLVSSGFDYFRGPTSGPTYPDVDPLVRMAQRQDTNIWSVYFPSASRRGRNFSYAWQGINNLARVSDETGGELFALGTGMPVSLKPHFDDIASRLGSQYLLTFGAVRERRGRHVRVDVSSDLPDLDFLAPAAVFVPAAE